MPLPRWPRQDDVLYANAYVWLVFLSALDIMFTWIVLARGGWEANAVAAQVLDRFGLVGLVVYKFAFIVVVIVICEFVGRRNHLLARKLSRVAVVIACLPLLVAVMLLLRHR